jgi:shikimate kinase
MNLPNNVILIGFMGAGKTSTGKELARLLGYNFWDMDEWIEEKNGKKVAKIFEEKGEEYFRSQEKNAVAWLKSKKQYIVSTGGGTWVSEENRNRLLKMGWCIWLKVSAENVLRRVGTQSSQRPVLAKSNNLLRKINEILSERNPLYSQAHASFDTNQKKPKEMALEIIKVLKEDNPFDLRPMQK